MSERHDGPLLYLTDADVASLVTIDDAVAALASVLPQESTGAAANLPKAVGQWEPRSSAHALGAHSATDGLTLFKTWVNTPRGATAMATLFDDQDGATLAIIEATTLGALRTAAIAGLATDRLASPDADELALVGTGRQALSHVAAIAAIRPLRRLRVFSPHAERRAAFVERARAAFGFDVLDCASVEDCVAAAPVVSLLTRAREPFLERATLAAGAHVNAMGAVLRANAELQADVLMAADLVVVDHIHNVRLTSREFHDRFGANPADWSEVRTIGELIGEGTRRGDEALTVFKSAGMGLSDLAVGAAVWRRARERGVGTEMDRPAMVAPRWRDQRLPHDQGQHTHG